MRLSFDSHGWEDYTSWLAEDRKILAKINRLINDALRDPQSGIGKPEPLKHEYQGAWSRRITQEHRLVYVVETYRHGEENLVILMCRGHYT